jgi:hypothetical protein
VPVPVEVPQLTPADALERILRGRLPAPVKHELAEQVRRALIDRDEMRAEAARALTEIEELAAAGTSALVLVQRVRELSKAF